VRIPRWPRPSVWRRDVIHIVTTLSNDKTTCAISLKLSIEALRWSR